jgi:hypothetical protein
VRGGSLCHSASAEGTLARSAGAGGGGRKEVDESMPSGLKELRGVQGAGEEGQRRLEMTHCEEKGSLAAAGGTRERFSKSVCERAPVRGRL